MKPLLIIITAITLSVTAAAKRQNTMQGNLKPVESTSATATPECDVVQRDTVSVNAGANLRLSGYDKPVKASRETMLVTNRYDRTLAAMTVTLSYFDMSKRLLHRVTREIACDIPPGETRMVNFTTWDRQNSYYYRLSAKPRRQATPYDVTMSVDSVILSGETVTPDAAPANP